MSYHPAEAVAETPLRLGRYELLGHLATGGMAEIHLARLAGEAGFEKTVVVKRLLPELVASKAFVAMFLDEGKLVARLDHPNVCEVHELGRDGAEYFLVMPYLDGVPASDFIARPRDPDRIAQLRVATGIIAQACAGLHHAHELHGADGSPLGLVHRDVSPSNLFVTTSGVVKVLDFGIAKVRGAAETEAGTIKGKTQYMAPEQLLGESLDRRCDVFALGIVLYELATHQRLFKRSSDYLAARAILEEPIPRADAVDPAVPAALADVIAKALDRSQAKRFEDARELARALAAAMAPHGGVATAAEIAAALADWHGAELSAMRTRQAKVIDDARSRARTTVPGKVAIDRARDSGARDGSWLVTMPRSVVRKRRRLVIATSVLVLAAVGVLLVLALSNRHRGENQLAEPAAGAIPVDAAATTVRVEPIAEPVTNVEPTKPVDKPRIDKPKRNVEKPVAKQPDVAKQPAAAKGDGALSVDSTPFAMIYVDSTYFGTTPLIGKSVPAGKHRIKAVLKDGRTKELSIEVAAGKTFSMGVLSWNDTRAPR